MSKTVKWLIVIVVAVVACVAAAIIALIVWITGFDRGDPSLPVYTLTQVPSAHPGYLRTTTSSGTMVYVNDFEEYALRLQDFDPTHAIGRPPFGNSKVCSILGQKPTDYITEDMGSEMPAYEVFRNVQVPPFDWRHAKFQSMRFNMPLGPAANKRTTDPAVIEDVVRILSEGTPTDIGSVVATNAHEVWMFTDQLPGLMFCPNVYIDKAGAVYLAENISIVDWPTLKTQARWIPASPAFAAWATTR